MQKLAGRAAPPPRSLADKYAAAGYNVRAALPIPASQQRAIDAMRRAQTRPRKSTAAAFHSQSQQAHADTLEQKKVSVGGGASRALLRCYVVGVCCSSGSSGTGHAREPKGPDARFAGGVCLCCDCCLMVGWWAFRKKAVLSARLAEERAAAAARRWTDDPANAAAANRKAREDHAAGQVRDRNEQNCLTTF